MLYARECDQIEGRHNHWRSSSPETFHLIIQVNKLPRLFKTKHKGPLDDQPPELISCPPNWFTPGIPLLSGMISHIYSAFHGINCTSRQPQWLSSVSSYYLPLKLKGVLIKNIIACFAKFTSYFNIAPCQAKYSGLPNHKFLSLSSFLFCFSDTKHPSNLQ